MNSHCMSTMDNVQYTSCHDSIDNVFLTKPTLGSGLGSAQNLTMVLLHDSIIG